MPLSVNETKIAVQEYLEEVADAAKRELGAERRYKSYRAKWEGGRLKSYTIKWRRGRKDATGKLRESIEPKVEIKGKNVYGYIEGLDYGVYVESGRKPGSWAPVDAIQKWIKNKPIRLQKPGGGFETETETKLKSLGFLINRKIKTFGIEPFPFIETSVKKFEPLLIEKIGEGLANDIVESILKDWTDGVRSISSS